MARLDITSALGPVVASVAAYRKERSDTATLWSRDAGTYYCNEALYRSSSSIRRLKITQPRDPSMLLPFAFVHLPSKKEAPVKTVVPAIAALAKALLVDLAL